MTQQHPPVDERGVRIGLALWVAAALGLVIVVLGAWGATGSSGRAVTVNLVYALLGLVTLGWALLDQRLVARSHPRARPLVVGLGAWLLLVAFLNAATLPLALLLAVTGIVIVFLSLAAEQEA